MGATGGSSTIAATTNTLASTAAPRKAAIELRFVVPIGGVMAEVLGLAMWYREAKGRCKIFN
jgi:hypothetical protein